MDTSNRHAAGMDGIIQHYRARTCSSTDDVVSDLLADLMHWCDKMGLDFDHELYRAERHYARD